MFFQVCGALCACKEARACMFARVQTLRFTRLTLTTAQPRTGIVDWDPDSPRGYNAPFETKELFDGHGGIIGLEDSDDWAVTPDSAASSKYDTYADGASVGRDQNVFANGYQFPEY